MESYRKVDLHRLAKAYCVAKKFVIYHGYSDEIDWQDSICFETVGQQTFLKEYTWVVLASGLSDKVVSKVYPKIASLVKNWNDLEFIENNFDSIYKNALSIFNNRLKISAILTTAILIEKTGYEKVKRNILTEGLSYLQLFPFIGKRTCYHLAKNIGLSYAKPDRHLVRISDTIGYDTPNDLCQDLSDLIDEKIQVVDLVLWRYATLDKNYLIKLKRMTIN